MSSLPIRNVIFDFGGVLVEWKPQQIIEEFYADESVRAAIASSVFKHPDWAELDRGTLDEDRATVRFSERTGRPVEELSAFLQHVRDSLIPMRETIALVQDLAQRGVPLYGLSNMPSRTFSQLRQRFDFWDAFRGIVISGDVKMIKPEPEIFEHIAAVHGLSPAETVFIDDHRPNIEAAQQLGFQTILFEDSPQCAASLNGMLAR